MLDPFIFFISSILELINIAVIVWVIINLLIHFEIVNRYNNIVQKVKYVLDRLIEPMLAPLRRFLRKLFGDMSGIDLSPILLILLIKTAQIALNSWF